MKNHIINLDNIDYNDIQKNIYDYLKTLDNWEDIEQVFGSNIDLFLSIMSGYSTYLSYKFRRQKDETFLAKASLPSSIYQISKTFGYNINRFTSPRINVIYDDENTILLKTGDVLGSYIDNGIEYEVVYYDLPKKYEKGDELSLSIGKIVDIQVKNQDDIILDIQPKFLDSIDNEIYLNINNKISKISKNVENFLVYDEPVDFSNDIYSTTLNIKVKKYFYGLYNITETDEINIIYLETNGLIDSINRYNLQLNNLFIYKDISHYGSNGDDLEFIRNISPYYFSTLRRMVTRRDHNYLIKTSPLIKDVYVERDDGSSLSYKLNINKDSVYKFIINGRHITIEYDGDDYINVIYDRLNKYKEYFITKLTDNIIYIESINGRDLDNFKLETSNNITKELIYEGKAPNCCSLNCYYIKYNTINEPLFFSKDERDKLSAFLEEYKMLGTNLIFIPAQVIYKDIHIKVKIIDLSLKDYVIKEIYKILENYELKLNTKFEYGNFIVDVSNITKDYNKIVEYMIPLQETFDVNCDKQYIKFNDIKIEVEEII